MTSRAVIPCIAAAILAVGCEDDLQQAFEDVRAAAPDVCKDYCEEKVACEWYAQDGAREDDAFSAEIRHCIVDCAWWSANGGYASENDYEAEEVLVVKHVGGESLASTLSCAYGSGAYRCDTGEGVPSEHLFEPRLESVCLTAAACLEDLGVDFSVAWIPTTADAGTCEEQGFQELHVPFF